VNREVEDKRIEFHVNEMMIGSSSLLDDEFLQGKKENSDVSYYNF
jgi:hypothetical protein